MWLFSADNTRQCNWIYSERWRHRHKYPTIFLSNHMAHIRLMVSSLIAHGTGRERRPRKTQNWMESCARVRSRYDNVNLANVSWLLIHSSPSTSASTTKNETREKSESRREPNLQVNNANKILVPQWDAVDVRNQRTRTKRIRLNSEYL